MAYSKVDQRALETGVLGNKGHLGGWAGARVEAGAEANCSPMSEGGGAGAEAELGGSTGFLDAEGGDGRGDNVNSTDTQLRQDRETRADAGAATAGESISGTGAAAYHGVTTREKWAGHGSPEARLEVENKLYAQWMDVLAHWRGDR
ncbi:unnamed protein product [Discosporangium mesarthrocarpum]